VADALEKPRVWAWPSQEILDSLEPRERRRQFLIMASEARGNAGPMNDDGVHPRPEWIERAVNFEAEARRMLDQKVGAMQRYEDAGESKYRNPFKRAAPAVETPQTAPDDEVI